MFYIISLLLITVSFLTYKFHTHKKPKPIKKLLHAIDTVKMGLFVRLSTIYKGKYSEDTTELLASAVINELFSQPPGNKDAEDFAKTNQDTIEGELLNIKNHKDICNVITQAVRINCLIRYYKDKKLGESSLDPIIKLKNYGILVTSDKNPEPNTFIQMTDKFYRAAFET